MRVKIFEWIERRFGDLGSQGLINYSEQATIKLTQDELKKVETRRFTVVIVLKATSENFIKDDLHLIWKKEIEEIFVVQPKDTFNFAVDWNLQNRTPTDINIVDGAKKGKLIKNATVKITINIDKKKFL